MIHPVQLGRRNQAKLVASAYRTTQPLQLAPQEEESTEVTHKPGSTPPTGRDEAASQRKGHFL